VGGRVGVFALDTASGRTLAHRADERFAMCSTFKWPLAAAVFARIDRGEASLEQRIPFGPADLMDHAPVAKEHVGEGAMTMETMARAAVTVSDNTAANLLLAWLGGLIHTFVEGTDAGQLWFLALVTVTSAPVLVLLWMRVGGSRRLQPTGSPRTA